MPVNDRAAAANVAPKDDFPFYNDAPVRISGGQWLFLLAMVVAGFLVLVKTAPVFTGSLTRFIPAIAFFLLPMLALAWVAPRHWTALFRKVDLRSVGWMVVFAVLNILVTVAVGYVVFKSAATNANPVMGMLAGQGTGDRMLFFLMTLPQLFGEEVLTILPLLAIAWLCHQKFGMARGSALALAWFLSAMWFGMAHLPTYGWNWLQCLVVIGSARLVLTLAYLKTRNIWVSFGAHVINDWTLFCAALFGGAALGAA